jgi:hypothetical protein
MNLASKTLDQCEVSIIIPKTRTCNRPFASVGAGVDACINGVLSGLFSLCLSQACLGKIIHSIGIR